MKTNEITFAIENENKVLPLISKYAADYEFLASTKDGEIYNVSFGNTMNYINFFQECGDVLLSNFPQ